jgi:hypothetical protein
MSNVFAYRFAPRLGALLACLALAGCHGERQAEAGRTEPPAPAAPREAPPLPATRLLQVDVEGASELREARRFDSPQGYAIYVLPQVAMTQEEPCCDLAFARVDEGYFMRIERIAPDTDLATLREAATLALSAVGAADVVAPARAEPAGGHHVELHLGAQGGEARLEQLVLRAGDGRYRVTLHLPAREASEGIVPAFRAMLRSLQTTGPLQRP